RDRLERGVEVVDRHEVRDRHLAAAIDTVLELDGKLAAASGLGRDLEVDAEEGLEGVGSRKRAAIEGRHRVDQDSRDELATVAIRLIALAMRHQELGLDLGERPRERDGVLDAGKLAVVGDAELEALDPLGRVLRDLRSIEEADRRRASGLARRLDDETVLVDVAAGHLDALGGLAVGVADERAVAELETVSGLDRLAVDDDRVLDDRAAFDRGAMALRRQDEHDVLAIAFADAAELQGRDLRVVASGNGVHALAIDIDDRREDRVLALEARLDELGVLESAARGIGGRESDALSLAAVPLDDGDEALNRIIGVEEDRHGRRAIELRLPLSHAKGIAL